MEKICKDCVGKTLEHRWIIMTWLMTVAFAVALFFYRDDPKKTATINLAEKLIICCLLPALAIFKVSCRRCCKKEEEIIMEEGEKVLKLFSKDLEAIQDLQKLANGGDEKARELLANIKEVGKNMLNSININRINN